MKSNRFINAGFKLLLVASALLPMSLSSCHHRSNDEDETFKESIVDDPARANRKAVERERADSVRRQDSLTKDGHAN